MTEAGGGPVRGTRQQAIDALMEHFANDNLTVEEFERRVDLAHKAETTEDLRKLLSDRPSGDLPVKADTPPGPVPERATASVPAGTVNTVTSDTALPAPSVRSW